MHDALILLAKGLAGGVLVCLFALLSEALEPKRFAGLLSAAPAVALASLTIGILDKGAHAERGAAVAMIAGAVAMAAYAAAVIWLLRRYAAMRASALAIGLWAICAALVAWPILT